ncbi:MAG: DNA gyrase subunit A [Chloroflexi bacterium]|nr:DNA gyrase subunit A [Chloroflexota bacterium]
MEIGLVRKIDIDQEMQQSYLDYAMSVIVSRAIPDARDGLKPVHRRILYAMHDMGMRPDTPYKKSARIVGEVLGKYHPHGDMAVYESMARMAQDFSMRYPLVDGQGNFGSVDGDSPAAMRYTEARMADISAHMLADIKKNTVDYTPNFDDTLTEPEVLPAALPNLLVNGITGIAVGMSTSVPPHNLGEVVDALIYMLNNWSKLDDVNVEDLMQFIQGPDFPTGGLILQSDEEGGLTSAYGTGRGRIQVRARAHIEEMSRGRHRIVVTELPYMTNKASLIARIANLARDGKLEGLADLRDESDRQGMRIVIELIKTADPEEVLRQLYKRTPMQSTFSIIMLALVNGEPRMLSLKQALRVYVEHRLDIVKRRSEYDLQQARDRAHILEGLRVALANLDEVIAIIRKSRSVDTARTNLRKRFDLSVVQATAILDMPLRRLASLERRKIDDEYKEVRACIRSLEALLHSPNKMRQTVSDELQAVKEKYSDRRRTQVIRLEGGQEAAPVRMSDLTPDKTVWVMASPDGTIARTLDDKLPRLSGSEAPGGLLRVNTSDTLYLISENGETAALPVHSLPEAMKPSDGLPVSRVSPLTSGHKLAAMLTLPPKAQLAEDWFVVAATRGGMVKKTAVSELPGPAATAFTIARVNDGDRLGWVKLSQGKSDVLLATASGMAIRFAEDTVRPMGLVAAGVMGIKLKVGDEVVGMEILPQTGEVFLLDSNGKAKRVPQSDFPRQGRYGQGVVAWKLPAAVRLVGMTVGKGTARVIFHLAKYAAKMARLDDAPVQKRTAVRGGAVLEVRAGDRIVGFTVPWDVPRPLAPVKQNPNPREAVTRPQAKSPSVRVPRSKKKKTPRAKK